MAKAGLSARVSALCAAAVLAGCASPAPPSPLAVAAPGERPLPAVRFFPGSLILPPPGARLHAPDTCGAGALAWLVGQPRSRIPIPTDLSRRRVSCTACVVAPEVRLDRLDILYDARTNIVTKVSCG